MLLRRWLLFCASLLCAAGAAAAEVDFAAVEQAFARADATRLRSQVAELDDRPASAGERDSRYLVAYARYRLAATYLQQQRPASAKPVLAQAIEQLRELLRAYPEFAEAMVLLAAVYGLEILRSPVKAVYLAPRANRLIDRGLELDPGNPRAYLMKGVVKFQTPTLFGGSVAEARELLETGLARAAATTRPAAIDWGLVDLHLWLGRVAADQNRRRQEQDHYAAALSISPDNHWVLQAMAGRGYRYEPAAAER
ncbi:hypothetical protein FKG94_25000 [Exilibacterium tricleocarpae]|uniref:Tetratricopeptide repeat protein n=1 Tax=Exilibacterium tricleocarpae TaxID=2591008 RepID=A0A545SS36_9GAMM|nr:hypothetical protein [Exilibacterium tricleocarpae]TQV67790.1 hypothetical protein FKG94_25000 [Exilibacterium tricleocarpae]